MPLARDVMRLAAGQLGTGPERSLGMLAEDGLEAPRGPWDAAFASLAMAMAGQPCPGLPSPEAATALAAMREAGLGAEAPETGDLAFHDGRVGLVELCDGETAQLIEGDVDGLVGRIALPASALEAMRPAYEGIICTLGYPLEEVDALEGREYAGDYVCRVKALNVRAEPSVYAGLAHQLLEGDRVELAEWHLYADGLVWGRLARDGPALYASLGTPDDPEAYLARVERG